jgi:hypothetical protein
VVLILVSVENLLGNVPGKGMLPLISINQKGYIFMRQKIMIGSLIASLVLYLGFVMTDAGSILPFILIGLLVSFVCAMMLLTDK